MMNFVNELCALKPTRLIIVLTLYLSSASLSFATELPPAVQADRYLVQMERHVRSGEYAAAIESLDKMLALQAEHGLETPSEVYFKYASVSQKAGFHKKAKDFAVRYLQVAGQDGEHYMKALEVLEDSELALEKAAQDLAKKQRELEVANRERLKKEEQARKEVEESMVIVQDALKSGGAGPKMVRVAGGGTRMQGSVKGQNRVSISDSFFLGKYEVTREEFSHFVEKTGYLTDAERELGCAHGILTQYFFVLGSHSEKKAMRNSKITWKNTGFDQTENHPVVCVSIHDARAYTEWLSKEAGQVYRLPSNDEWFYAAYAGVPQFAEAVEGSSSLWFPLKYGPFVSKERICQYANYVNPSYQDYANLVEPFVERFFQNRVRARNNIRHIRNRSPHPIDAPFNSDDGCQDGEIFTARVGTLNPNYIGIYDLWGNVKEIVEADLCATRSKYPTKNPQAYYGGSRGRISRLHPKTAPPGECQVVNTLGYSWTHSIRDSDGYGGEERVYKGRVHKGNALSAYIFLQRYKSFRGGYEFTVGRNSSDDVGFRVVREIGN